jgi:uncharacterized membrane protein/uncharacterized membrane protein YgcG
MTNTLLERIMNKMNPLSETNNKKKVHNNDDDDDDDEDTTSQHSSKSRLNPIDEDAGGKQQQQQQQQQQQPLDDENDDNANDSIVITADSVYEFYVEHIFPAIMSSLPILLHRIWMDAMIGIGIAVHKFYLFLLPTWLREQYEYRQLLLAATATATTTGSSGNVLNQNGWLISPNVLAQQLWEHVHSNIRDVNATIADFMLQHFDSNNDGHISPHELINMTELLARLPHHNALSVHGGVGGGGGGNGSGGSGNGGGIPDYSFWAWFSREWPLMDWKVGVFIWQTFGGILLVIAVLSIVPGRFHAWSGKILRWPILGLTYALITVELIVYIVIRLGIRVAEALVATPKHRTLRRKMTEAKTYEEWYQYAAALDLSQKRDQWQKQVDDDGISSYQYNWALIKQLIRDMKEARDVKHDTMLALAVLQQCTRNNVGGIMSEDLFTKTYTGQPKFLVMEFIQEVTKTVHWVTDHTLAQDEEEQLQRVSMQQQDVAGATVTLEAYQKKLMYKSRKERDKVWRSLVALATLNFIGETKDDELNGSNERHTTTNIDENNDNNINDNVKSSNHDNSSSNNRMKDNSPQSPTQQSKMKDRTSPKTDQSNRDVVAAAAITTSDNPLEETDWIHPTVSNDKEGSTPRSRASSMGTNASTGGVAGPNNLYPMKGCHKDQLLAFLKRARAAYGRTALCLSGGSMMGLYHVGHLRGLMETNCLPNIVSGCSAGSVIGAILCTRNNEELARDLDPEVMGPKMKCFERTWPDRIVSVWKTGNLFSGDDWHRMIQW